ncbi:MAG: L-threonylcarbamoyladenylate synthase [Candidatus Bathyarchaeia archaeon]|jgi:L-threonylcarbamoyladenylate synthase|nr:threonylcarbamoyl-AMP synthase [Candidatus Bathyarchaeota archaeon A05DMB-4]MDH7595527.1 L-threonylcarbamoyladenylate synthase [Candidatus Bathyarchaeota archaeon]
MKVLTANEKTIRIAVQTVEKGGVIVYPTDTVYGLGCDPFNREAVKRIFTIKGERTKPLPILASNIKEAEKIAHVTEQAQKLAEKFWPGPLTMVLLKKPSLLDVVTCGLDSVGVRVPNHPVALELIREAGGLLVGTSANKSGEKPPQTAEEAARQIGEEVDLVLDGGFAPLGESSTIVDLVMGIPRILRHGPVKVDDILEE